MKEMVLVSRNGEKVEIPKDELTSSDVFFENGNWYEMTTYHIHDKDENGNFKLDSLPHVVVVPVIIFA